MIEERDRINFFVIMIEIFDHFPDHGNIYTILIKVKTCNAIYHFSLCTEHNLHIYIYILEKEENLL